MNYVIWEDDNIVIWYSTIDGELHVNNQTVTFKQFIRAVDTIANRSQVWKRDLINTWAENYGFIRKAV